MPAYVWATGADMAFVLWNRTGQAGRQAFWEEKKRRKRQTWRRRAWKRRKEHAKKRHGEHGVTGVFGLVATWLYISHSSAVTPCYVYAITIPMVQTGRFIFLFASYLLPSLLYCILPLLPTEKAPRCWRFLPYPLRASTAAALLAGLAKKAPSGAALQTAAPCAACALAAAKT